MSSMVILDVQDFTGINDADLLELSLDVKTFQRGEEWVSGSTV